MKKFKIGDYFHYKITQNNIYEIIQYSDDLTRILVELQTTNVYRGPTKWVSVSDFNDFINEGLIIIHERKQMNVESTGAKRDNEGKLRWTLLDTTVFADVVRVLEYGAEKYGIDNWKKGFKWSTIINSTIRHLNAFWFKKEDNDPETNLSHMAHVACNVYFMLWHIANKKELDDRTESQI